MRSTLTEAALALNDWIELSILLKATIMLIIGLTAARLAIRARASLRHLLLAATLAALLALPLIVFTAPIVTIEVPTLQAGDTTIVASRMAIPSDASLRPTSNSDGSHRTPESVRWSAPSWTLIVRAAWIAGALLLFVSLGIDLWRLRRLSRDGLPWPELRALTQTLAAECGVRRPIEILLHEEIAAPLTCGAWRPVILLPADARGWRTTSLRCALVHELEHVRRGDWVTGLMARVTCACYWFHPLAWVAWRRLCLEAERACDDAVVGSAERIEYAEQLVSLARRMSKASMPQPALGMANRSDLSTRISALLDGNQRRGRAGLFAAASAMGVASVVVLAIAPVRAVAQKENPTTAANREAGSSTGGERARRSESLDRALYEAAESGDISEIDKLIGAGANVNCALDGDGSPLIAAARSGRLEVVRLLLERGADVNMPVPGDGNPLIMAAGKGHIDVVVLLLDRGASIDQVVAGDENALIGASGGGHLSVVKLLVSRGADVNARVRVERVFERLSSGEWRTPLSMARRGGHDAVVTYLLSVGARE